MHSHQQSLTIIQYDRDDNKYKQAHSQQYSTTQR